MLQLRKGAFANSNEPPDCTTPVTSPLSLQHPPPPSLCMGQRQVQRGKPNYSFSSTPKSLRYYPAWSTSTHTTPPLCAMSGHRPSPLPPGGCPSTHRQHARTDPACPRSQGPRTGQPEERCVVLAPPEALATGPRAPLAPTGGR